MEKIKVKFFSINTKKIQEEIVECYSLTEAIEIIRTTYSYQVLILSVAYVNENIYKILCDVSDSKT